MPARGVELDVSTLADWVGACGGDVDAAGGGDPSPCLRLISDKRNSLAYPHLWVTKASKVTLALSLICAV